MKKVKILALLSAIIAALLLYNFLNTISEPVVVEVSKTEVITASQNIPPNTAITKEMLKSTMLPDEAILLDSEKIMDDVVGKVSTAEIMAGEQILSSRLVTLGDAKSSRYLPYAITQGMRAITIGVNNISGLSNMILPGNKVDVIAQYEIEVKEPDGNKTTIDYTVMLLENIKVLAVDDKFTEQEKAESETPYVSLTLEVTPEEAMEISMSEYKGQLRAALRSPLDEKITLLPALTIDEIIFKNK